MGVIGKKLRGLEGGRVAFFCPGCRTHHQVTVDPAQGGPVWGYNGNPDAPTFTPSILARSGHYARGETPGECWCDFAQRFPAKDDPGFKCVRCHSFVTDGRIQFLPDCAHALAGQTVDLPDLK